MGISSTRKQVAVVAVSVALAGWLSSAGPAGATAEGEQQSPAPMFGSGVCGWFSEDLAGRSETVNVCGYDLLGPAGEPVGGLPRPVVVIDRYVCSLHGDGRCSTEHHELEVDRRDFTLDPLLRRARIVAPGVAGCGVEVEFVGTAPARPHGGVSEYHGVARGPWMSVFGHQRLAAPAQWWGKVCGRFLVANGMGATGEMWRSVHAGVGLSGGGPVFGGDPEAETA